MNPVKESTAENRVNAESLSTDTTRSLWFEEIVNPFFFVISHNIYIKLYPVKIQRYASLVDVASFS